MVYVTHDQVEAMTLADRIVVLHAGTIMQAGTPRTLYERPENLFVAQFLGSPRMNLFPAVEEAGAVRIEGAARLMPLMAPLRGTLAQIGLRPEQCQLTEPAAGWITGRVAACEYHGAALHVMLATPGAGTVSVLAPPGPALAPGTTCGIGWNAEACHPFAASGARI